MPIPEPSDLPTFLALPELPPLPFIHPHPRRKAIQLYHSRRLGDSNTYTEIFAQGAAPRFLELLCRILGVGGPESIEINLNERRYVMRCLSSRVGLIIHFPSPLRGSPHAYFFNPKACIFKKRHVASCCSSDDFVE